MEELLVLSKQSEELDAISGWCPPAYNNTLEETVTAHNLRCHEIVKKNTPAQLLECGETVTPALRIKWCDLDSADELKGLWLGRPTILLLDLDAIQGDVEKLTLCRDYIASRKRPIHLVQLSQSTEAESYAHFFDDVACILIIEDDICRRQADFEVFLDVYRQAHGNAWHGIARNPLDAPCRSGMYAEPYVHPRHGHFINPLGEKGETVRRVYLAYRDLLPGLVARTRDVAMARKLSAEQTTNLGRAAAIQELLLALVTENVRHRPVYPVSVEAIRKSLLNVPADEPYELGQLLEVKLVAVHLPHDRLQPSQEECEQLAELGLANGAFAAVHYDRPDFWERFENLQDMVTAETFTAELPGWDMTSEPCAVGLSETSFGIRIEESFSSRLDSKYIQKKV